MINQSEINLGTNQRTQATLVLTQKRKEQNDTSYQGTHVSRVTKTPQKSFDFWTKVQYSSDSDDSPPKKSKALNKKSKQKKQIVISDSEDDVGEVPPSSILDELDNEPEDEPEDEHGGEPNDRINDSPSTSSTTSPVVVLGAGWKYHINSTEHIRNIQYRLYHIITYILYFRWFLITP